MVCERHADNDFQHISMWIQALSKWEKICPPPLSLSVYHYFTSASQNQMKWKTILFAFPNHYVSMVSETMSLTLLFDCYKMHNGTHNGWIVDFVLLFHSCRYHAQHAGAATDTAKKVNITRKRLHSAHTHTHSIRSYGWVEKTATKDEAKVFMTNKSKSQSNLL